MITPPQFIAQIKRIAMNLVSINPFVTRAPHYYNSTHDGTRGSMRARIFGASRIFWFWSELA